MKPVWPRASDLNGKLIVTLLAMLTLALPPAVNADQPNEQNSHWEPISSPRDPVQLWHRNSASADPYQLVRGEITIDAPLLPLLALLQDADTQHQWLPYTHQVKVVDQPAPEATLVHFLTQSRWPFKPRDAVTLFSVQSQTANQIRIDMQNQPDALPLQAGYLRIRFAEGHWLLSALENCQTRVQYQSGSRWGGLIPQWLVDSSNADLAVESLNNLKHWAEQHYRDYQNDYAKYSYLDAPPRHRTCR